MWYYHIQTDESKVINKCPKSSKEETPLHIQKKEKNLQKNKWKPHLRSDESKVTNEYPESSNSEENLLSPHT